MSFWACSNGNGNRKEEEEEALYAFYESVYDRIHHYIFHLFDIGLRVEASSLTLSEGGGDEKETESEGVAVDKLFAAEREHIKLRRKELNMVSERMNPENNKFTIQTVGEQQGRTLSDVLCQEISAKLDTEIMQRVQLFLVENAFESDSIELDSQNVADSNLYPLIQSQSVFHSMTNTINSVKRMFSLSFRSTLCLHSHALTQCVAAHSPPDSLSIIGRTVMR